MDESAERTASFRSFSLSASLSRRENVSRVSGRDAGPLRVVHLPFALRIKNSRVEEILQRERGTVAVVVVDGGSADHWSPLCLGLGLGKVVEVG
jgi:hypothetical protein